MALTASAAVSAAAANLVGGPAVVVTLPFATTAAIDTSNTTVGFADSNLYGETPADIDRSLDAMQSMGVQNVRILIPWGVVEPVQGLYNWSTVDYIVNAANQRNMGVLGVLNSTPTWSEVPGQPPFAGAPTSPQAYGDFAGQVAQRYAGKISAYEIWNEPNVYSSWLPKPDPAVYTQLLQAAYPAIKAADPNATVIGGVLMSTVGDGGNLAYNPVSYLQQMYADGAQGNFDALSFHPYHYTLPFSQGGPYGDASAINQMSLMHQLMIDNGDGTKLIWASEYGEPTSAGATEDMQSSFIQDFLSSWSQIPYAGPSFIYTTRDVLTGSPNPEDTFGVLRSDWTWKPAAYVIQQWTATHPQNPAPTELTAAMSPVSTNATTLLAASGPVSTNATTLLAASGPVSTAVTTASVTAPATAAATPETATVTPPPTPASATTATSDPPATAPVTAATPATTAGPSTGSDSGAAALPSAGTSGLNTETPATTTGTRTTETTGSTTSSTGTTGSPTSTTGTNSTSQAGSTSTDTSAGSAATPKTAKSSPGSTSGSSSSTAGTRSPKH
ncbi:cellulase family glycosylhydrolase [Mycolicibacterium moriokaense]|uniref:cellulase family glycosylhydrolase n=1 Tax=Mycolicibacterium moriokaense TaxID=39691 RepID=UPI001F19C7D8|nr:cellulase family glycosylhydrolase [Mycolicibacterium moriokaense]